MKWLHLRAVALLVLFIAALALPACDVDDLGFERVPVTTGDEDPGADEIDGDVDGLVDSDCPDRDLTPDEDNLRTVERATLCLINAEREHRDLHPLSNDEDLAEAARAKSRDMVEQRYFQHVGPDDRDVRDWVGDTDYLDNGGGYALGENLGWASGDSATPERLVLGWMQSPGHRRNVLAERFEDSGIGVVLGAPREEGGGGATYTHVFGATPGSG